MKQKLFEIINKYEPNRLILLGDVKQAIPKISLEEWKEVPEFFEEILGSISNVSVIRGNHDGDIEPLLPQKVKVFPSEGMLIGDRVKIGLFHGHAWPSQEILSANILVIGHIHPVIRIRDKTGLWIIKQVWIKTKCCGEKLVKAYLKHHSVNKSCPKEIFEEKHGTSLDNPTLIIMPAFNDLVGGISVDNVEINPMSPILRSKIVNIDDAELYLLEGNYLGLIRQFKRKDS